MGCDIHSRAEIRIDGEWQMLGEVFIDTSSMRWVKPTDEFLKEAPDHILLDLVDYYIMSRFKDGREYMPEIPIHSSAEAKILAFKRAIDEKVEWGRKPENHNKINRHEDGSYDSGGWARWMSVQAGRLAEEADLSDTEREQIRQAVLNYRTYAMESWTEMGYDESEYDTHDENRITYTEHKLPEDDDEWFTNEPLDSRNYTLFAALADVRNRAGGVEPIWSAEKDGETVHAKAHLYGTPAPEDASAEVKKFQDSYGVDGHSHTWLTLAELEAYDLDGLVTYSGLVTAAQFEEMTRNGWPDKVGCGPDQWCGGAGSAVCFTPESYEKWVAVNRPRVTPRNQGRFGIVEQANVLPEDVPDEVQPPPEVRDRVYEQYLGSDDGPATYTMVKALEKESRLWLQDRYVYNGMENLFVSAEWQEKRKDQLGIEFENMIRVFRRLIEEHDITPADVRVVCFFDN